MAESCLTCRFYLPSRYPDDYREPVDTPLCRRRAPTASVHPPTTPGGWCGEWEEDTHSRHEVAVGNKCPACRCGTYREWPGEDVSYLILQPLLTTKPGEVVRVCKNGHQWRLKS